MKVFSASISLLAILLPGCGNAGSDQQKAANRLLLEACPVYIRHENSDRTLEQFAFIRPEHVAAIRPAKPYYKGEHAMWIILNDAGSLRMTKETQNAIGKRIAFFCGRKEIERATINGTIEKQFRIALPETAPNNSFNRKPLRGSG